VKVSLYVVCGVEKPMTGRLGEDFNGRRTTSRVCVGEHHKDINGPARWQLRIREFDLSTRQDSSFQMDSG